MCSWLMHCNGAENSTHRNRVTGLHHIYMFLQNHELYAATHISAVESISYTNFLRQMHFSLAEEPAQNVWFNLFVFPLEKTSFKSHRCNFLHNSCEKLNIFQMCTHILWGMAKIRWQLEEKWSSTWNVQSFVSVVQISQHIYCEWREKKGKKR